MPAILADLGGLAQGVDGIVQFDLAGERRPRSWFLDFTGDRPGVVEGEHEAPDVCVFLEEDLVLPMLSGALDVDRAMETGALDVYGDRAVLARLARALSGGISALELRGFGAASLGSGRAR